MQKQKEGCGFEDTNSFEESKSQFQSAENKKQMQKQKDGCRFEDANSFQESKNRFQADANSFPE